MSQTKTFRFTQKVVSVFTVLTVALPVQLFAILPIAVNAGVGPPPVVLFEDDFNRDETTTTVGNGWEEALAGIHEYKEKVNVGSSNGYARLKGENLDWEKHDGHPYAEITHDFYPGGDYNALLTFRWRSAGEFEGGERLLVFLNEDEKPLESWSLKSSAGEGWEIEGIELSSEICDEGGDVSFMSTAEAYEENVDIDDVSVTCEVREPEIQVFKFYDMDDNGGEYDPGDGDYPREGWEFCLVGGEVESIFDPALKAFAEDNGFTYISGEENIAFREFVEGYLGDEPAELDVIFLLIDEDYIGDDVVDCQLTDSAGMVYWTEDIEKSEDYLLFERLTDDWKMTYFDYSQWGEGEVDLFSDQGYAAFSLYEGDRIELIFGNQYQRGAIYAFKFNDLNGNGEWDWIDSNDNDRWDEGEGEPPIEGWEICIAPDLEELEGDGAMTIDPESVCEETMGGEMLGWASFEDITPGAYRVWEEEREGWYPTTPASESVFVERRGENEVYFGNHLTVCVAGENLVKNGSFETPEVTSVKKWQRFANGVAGLEWAVEWVSGGFGLAELQEGVTGPTPNGEDGGQFIELDSDAPTKISQTLQTIPGQAYELAFQFSPRGGRDAADNTMGVYWGENPVPVLVDTISEDGRGNNTTVWKSYKYQLFATDYSTKLLFVDEGQANSLGNYVDDVSVQCDFYCGDGVVNQEEEQCDGEDGLEGDQYCTNECEIATPYCGDGIVNQEWEQCDLGEENGDGECSVQCQLPSEQCTSDIFAQVDMSGIDNFDSEDKGSDMTYDVYLGQGLYPIPNGTWFPLFYDGAWITDLDVDNYEDVPGMAVQRVERGVAVRHYGSLDKGAKEHSSGKVNFFGASAMSVEEHTSQRNQNKLEPQDDSGWQDGDGIGNYNAGNDDVQINNGVVDFWMTVTVADDGFTTWVSEPIECPATINAYKFNDLNGNGEWDEEEPPLPEWEICMDQDGRTGNGRQMILETELEKEEGPVYCELTDEDGLASWEVEPGAGYEVWETQQEGWNVTTENEGFESIHSIDSGDTVDVFFGNQYQGSTAQAWKFNDLNGDGLWGEEEPAITGWEICLYGAEVGQTWIDSPSRVARVIFAGDTTEQIPVEVISRDLVSCQSTDVDGFVEWDNLPSDWYVLDEENQNDWHNTTDNDPSDAFFLNWDSSYGVIFGNQYVPTRTPTVTRGGSPVIQISKIADPATVNPGSTITYTITVANTGSTTATNLTLNDVMPAGLDGTTGSTRTWSLGNLDAGDSTTVTYSIDTPASLAEGTYKNVATVTGPSTVSATADADVFVTLGSVLGEESRPKLVIDVSAVPAFGDNNQNFDVVVSVTNQGGAVAEGVTVTLVLPEGFSEGGTVAGIPMGVFAGLIRSVMAAGGTLTWDAGDLLAGESWSTTATINGAGTVAVGVYSVTGTAMATNHDLVMDGVSVEIREGEVLGLDTLPETGGVPGAMGTFGAVALIVMLLYGFAVKKFLNRGAFTVHEL